MRLREARKSDALAIERFLSGHAETSMFLRGNLAAHGIGSSHHHGTTFFLHHGADGIDAVFGRANGGFLMCQMPKPDPALAHAFADQIRNSHIVGITGVPEQVSMIVDALGLPDDAWKVAVDEPLFTRDLLTLPKSPDTPQLRPACADDAALLREWFWHYELDTGLSCEGPALDRRARARAEAVIHGTDNDTLRILQGRHGHTARNDSV